MHTLSDRANALNRSPVHLTGLEKRFELPTFAARPIHPPLRGFPAYPEGKSDRAFRAMMTCDRDTELLSKKIRRSISPAELDDPSRYEAAQPQVCPKCHARVRSEFMPMQIVRDVEKCPGPSAVLDALLAAEP